ncbi:tRNA pseudouridine(55) synthase TruB [Candidatus Neomarinimicrobiota bacterium]
MIDLVQAFWKPVGWTSFDVVKKLRGITGVKKVGHTGTLDPFAEGILLLCFGIATKRSAEFMQLEKEYIGTISLGVATDTIDPTGQITEEQEVAQLSEAQIRAACTNFVGKIVQIPPMFSAKKVGGERLYKKARRGESVQREPHEVVIHSIELLTYEPPNEFTIKVTCGKGTYIRVLADDIAKTLNTVGHLKQLIRTRIGPYDRSKALDMQQAENWKPIAA